MVAYDVFFLCKECGAEHPLGVKIPIPEGPAQKMSIGAFYTEKEIPQAISRLSDRLFECPKSKTRFFHDDIDQLFLVPLE
jgi:hypothetical protein